MNKVASLFAVALFAASAGTAAATPTPGQLQVFAWKVQGFTATVSVQNTIFGPRTGTFNIGSFTGKFTPTGGSERNAGSLFCVDIFHTFSSGQTWQSTRFEVPTDPVTPPPWNTDHAAWLYQTYAAGAITQAKAGGLQLALWEVTHQEDWYSGGYNASGPNAWYSQGNFKVTSTTTSQRDEATNYLTALSTAIGNGSMASAGHYAYYYRDSAHDPGGEDRGQGQIGDVPEPSTMLIVGLGFLVVAGSTWRRRSNRVTRS